MKRLDTKVRETLSAVEQRYGEMVEQKMIEVGFMPTRILFESSFYVLSVPILDGSVNLMFVCKYLGGETTVSVANAAILLARVLPVHQCIFVTNGIVPEDIVSFLEQASFQCVDRFKSETSMVALLYRIGLLPAGLADMLVQYEQKTYPEKSRKYALQPLPQDTPQMTPMAKYEAGLYHPYLVNALAAVSMMPSVSVGGLARRMHIDADIAKVLIRQLVELNVIGKSDDGSPRPVLLTRGMIEKQFQIRIRTELDG